MRSVLGIPFLALVLLACETRSRSFPPPSETTPSPAVTPPPAEAAPERVEYRMSPVLDDDVLIALEIELRFHGEPSGQTRLHLPEQWASERELWRYVRDFEVEGAHAVEDDGPAVKVIRAEPAAPLVVRYRVVSAYDREPDVGDRQPFAPIVRPEWFYAFGEALFAVPDDRYQSPARFSWVGAPSGFTFASDLQQLTERSTVAEIRESIAMGGPGTQLYTAHVGEAPLQVAIRGDYGFTNPAFVDMARTIIEAEHALWGEPGEPFTILVAPLLARPPNQSLGGTGRADGFALTISQDVELERLRHLIAHEYFHTWNPRRLGGDPDQDGEMLGKWFTEGFTELYTWRLLLRSGVYRLEDFVADWNAALLEYTGSPVRNEPNSRIVADYWNDPAVGQLPYRRGPMLGVIWDQRLREATGGARGLDDVLRAMRAEVRQAHGAPVADAALRFPTTYVELGGPDLQPDLERFVERGETITLPADVFGGCVRVVTTANQQGSDPVPLQQLEIVGATAPDERAACVQTVAGLDP